MDTSPFRSNFLIFSQSRLMSFKWRSCTKCGSDMSPQVFGRWTVELGEKQNKTSSRNVAYPAPTETNYTKKEQPATSVWIELGDLVHLLLCYSWLRKPGGVFHSTSATCSMQKFKQHLTWKHTVSITKLRHCATSRKAAGSIPDGVIGIFHWHNPSGRTMALGLTRPLTEMTTTNISWGVKAAGA